MRCVGRQAPREGLPDPLRREGLPDPLRWGGLPDPLRRGGVPDPLRRGGLPDPLRRRGSRTSWLSGCLAHVVCHLPACLGR